LLTERGGIIVRSEAEKRWVELNAPVEWEEEKAEENL
jgi:hypothetical protein